MTPVSKIFSSVALVVLASACADASKKQSPIILSLLGDTLHVVMPDSATKQQLEENLKDATDSLRDNPQSADHLIWVGRRLAYLGRYQEAIDTFTVGIERFPNDARFLRHRGHRYLTIRKVAEATSDFEQATTLIAGKADAIEPDGAPNSSNIPLSTDQFNIWYHLGLSRYVSGDFQGALVAYDSTLLVSVNPDLYVATSYWRYLTLRHLGRQAAADSVLQIAREPFVLIENESYFKLLRLFAAVDDISNVAPSDSEAATVADATTAYGISMWHYFSGREEEAARMWTQLTKSRSWPSFGVLAAESELKRTVKK